MVAVGGWVSVLTLGTSAMVGGWRGWRSVCANSGY